MKKVVLEIYEGQDKALKDLLDAGFEHLEGCEPTDEGYMVELTEAWTALRRQLQAQGIDV